MDPPQNPLPDVNNAANNLVDINGQTTPGIYRSLRRYVARCALVGCSIPARPGSGFCCLGHQDLAGSHAESAASFHYVGAFLNAPDRDLVCSICLLNRVRGFQVGIPSLDGVDVFGRFPWEQPDVFRTDVGKCEWLFFKTASEYKQIRRTRVKWKLDRRYKLQLSGHHHENLYTTSLGLRLQKGKEAEEECDMNLAGQWSLHLFQCQDFSLYCMSLAGPVEGELKVDREKSNKGLPPPPKPNAPKSASYKKGKTSSLEPATLVSGAGHSLNSQGKNLLVRSVYHTISADDLHKAETSSDFIAAKLREFHKIDMPGPKNFLLWERLRTWLKEAKNLLQIDESRLEAVEDENNLLEERLTRDYQERGFCHNDLSNAITITDYEYSSFNPIAYDIANHFSELAANYHSDTPHSLDYSLYPGEEERRRFISTYLDSTGYAASEEEAERLLSDAESYSFGKSYLLGTVGNHLVQGHVNKIEFD